MSERIPQHAFADAVLAMHHIKELALSMYVAAGCHDTAAAFRQQLAKWDRWGSPMDHDLADAIRTIMDRAAEQGDAYREQPEDLDAADEPDAAVLG